MFLSGEISPSSENVVSLTSVSCRLIVAGNEVASGVAEVGVNEFGSSFKSDSDMGGTSSVSML